MKTNSVVIIMLFTMSIGCEGPAGPAGPIGPAGSLLSGDILGRILIYDSLNVATDNSGALIKIDGTTHSTLSDSTGKWKFKGVKSGTYVITCSKPGFSTDKNISFQFVGGDTPAFGGTFELYKLPTIYVSSLEMPQPYQRGINIVGTLSSQLNPNKVQQVFLFYGYDSLPAILAYNYISFRFDIVSAQSFNVYFDSSFFRNANIKSGTKIYFVAHTIASTYAGYYNFDAAFVYTSLCEKPSNVVSYIVP